MTESEKILYVNIDSLVPSQHQPRKKFNKESLKELSSSIKEFGILNPVLVRKTGEKYEIIAGERRVRAAKMAGLNEIPIIVKDYDDKKLLEVALIENLQRENITPIEEAKSYQEILTNSQITEQQLSEMIGKSQSFISNKLRLLKLPEFIQNALIERKISERHARSLMTVDGEERQEELLNRIINEKMTVKDLDSVINEKKTTEEEIKSAIDDIMKTLNIEEKEEKESDNMNNNGNFFPNYNSQPENSNMSLNNMNMQSMGPAPAMNPEPPLPPLEPMPNMEVPGAVNIPAAPAMPEMNSAVETQMPIPEAAPAPNMGYEMPMGPAPQPVENIQPPMPEFNMPTYEMPAPQPEIPAMTYQEPAVETPVMQDTPLFNQDLTLPPENPQPIVTPEPNMNEPFYEVPVDVAPVAEPSQPTSRVTEVEQLLSSNGISFKTYSNDQGHCIIIEL